eukprot:311571-Chlamydomonas_euryale.AAC.4
MTASRNAHCSSCPPPPLLCCSDIGAHVGRRCAHTRRGPHPPTPGSRTGRARCGPSRPAPRPPPPPAPPRTSRRDQRRSGSALRDRRSSSKNSPDGADAATPPLPPPSPAPLPRPRARAVGVGDCGGTGGKGGRRAAPRALRKPPSGAVRRSERAHCSGDAAAGVAAASARPAAVPRVAPRGVAAGVDGECVASHRLPEPPVAAAAGVAAGSDVAAPEVAAAAARRAADAAAASADRRHASGALGGGSHTCCSGDPGVACMRRPRGIDAVTPSNTPSRTAPAPPSHRPNAPSGSSCSAFTTPCLATSSGWRQPPSGAAAGSPRMPGAGAERWLLPRVTITGGSGVDFRAGKAGDPDGSDRAASGRCDGDVGGEAIKQMESSHAEPIASAPAASPAAAAAPAPAAAAAA